MTPSVLRAAAVALAGSAVLASAALPATAASAAPAPASGPAVAAWGQGPRGELGNGTATAVALLPVLAQLPPGTQITQVAPGCNHSLALTSAGTVLAWGDNSEGQLGNGTVGGFNATPAPVKLPPGTAVRSLSGGCGFSLAVTTGGQLLAWGGNGEGELGNGTAGNPVATPAPVKLPAGVTVRAAAGGLDHALALTTDGRVYAWGANAAGELGNGTTGKPNATPALVPLPSGALATAVTAGEGDSLAALASGGVVGWGDDSEGSLGDGRTNAVAPSPVRTLMSPGVKVTSLFAGCFHTLALTSTGTVMAWGDNGNGQLGIGSPQGSSTFPVRVPLPQFGQVASIGGGCVHSVVVTDRGQALAWGAGTLLGNGSQTSSSSPVVVRLPAGQDAIGTGGSAVGDFSLAILRPAQ